MKRPWVSFVLTYVLFAAASSAAVYYGVPYLAQAPWVRPAFEQAVARLQAITEQASAARPAPPAPQRRPASTQPPSSSPPSDPQPTTSPVQLFWAVVQTPEAQSYSTRGKARRALDPGTILEVLSVQDSKSGQVAVCAPVGNRNTPDPFVMRVQDLHIVDGGLAAVPHGLKNLHVRRALLNAEIAKLAAANRPAANTPDAPAPTGNAVVDEYEAARREYLAFGARRKELMAASESSSGARREEALDELRQMKGQDIELAARYKNAKAAYDTWVAAHGAPASPQDAVAAAPDHPDSPQIRALREEIASLDARIQQMNGAQ